MADWRDVVKLPGFDALHWETMAARDLANVGGGERADRKRAWIQDEVHNYGPVALEKAGALSA